MMTENMGNNISRSLEKREGRIPWWQKAFWLIVALSLWVFFALFSVNVRRKETVLAICILGVFTLLARKYQIGKGLRFDRTTPWILFLLCFLSRYGYCFFIAPRVAQFNDFAEYLRIANVGDYSSPIYLFFPHKLSYPLLLRAFGLLTQERAFFFQSLCAAGIAPLLYRMGRQIKNEKLGLLAAVLYLVWPGQLIYGAIVTDEHLVAFLLTAIVALLLDVYYFLQKDKGGVSPTVIAKSVIAGLFCGICAMFRDLAIIILIAATICALGLLLCANRGQRKGIALLLLLLLCGRVIGGVAIKTAASYATGLPMKDSTTVAHMFWALDPDGEGAWRQEKANEFFAIGEKHGYNIDETNREALQTLIEKIQAAPDKMPGLLLKKGIYSYADNSELFFWVTQSIRPEYQSELLGGFGILQSIEQIYYLIFVLCFLMSVISQKKEIRFISLITVGAIAAQLLIECQGRYKYPLEPLWTLVAAHTLANLAGKARKKG